jgi:hypothetical protein
MRAVQKSGQNNRMATQGHFRDIGAGPILFSADQTWTLLRAAKIALRIAEILRRHARPGFKRHDALQGCD